MKNDKRIIFNVLNFSEEQLDMLEKEMRAYKVPWLYKCVFGVLYKAGAIIAPLLFVILVTVGLIYNYSAPYTQYLLWPYIKIFSLSIIAGTLFLVAVSWVWHRIKVLNKCKKLGITLYEWNLLATAFQIKFI